MLHLIKFCRLCLNSEGEFYDMCEDDSMEKVLACIKDLELPDHVPTLICMNCTEQVDKFYEFRNLCLQSEFILNNYIDKFLSGTNSSTFVNTKLQVNLLKNFATKNIQLGAPVKVLEDKTNESNSAPLQPEFWRRDETNESNSAPVEFQQKQKTSESNSVTVKAPESQQKDRISECNSVPIKPPEFQQKDKTSETNSALVKPPEFLRKDKTNETNPVPVKPPKFQQKDKTNESNSVTVKTPESLQKDKISECNSVLIKPPVFRQKDKTSESNSVPIKPPEFQQKYKTSESNSAPVKTIEPRHILINKSNSSLSCHLNYFEEFFSTNCVNQTSVAKQSSEVYKNMVVNDIANSSIFSEDEDDETETLQQISTNEPSHNIQRKERLITKRTSDTCDENQSNKRSKFGIRASEINSLLLIDDEHIDPFQLGGGDITERVKLRKRNVKKQTQTDSKTKSPELSKLRQMLVRANKQNKSPESLKLYQKLVRPNNQQYEIVNKNLIHKNVNTNTQNYILIPGEGESVPRVRCLDVTYFASNNNLQRDVEKGQNITENKGVLTSIDFESDIDIENANSSRRKIEEAKIINANKNKNLTNKTKSLNMGIIRIDSGIIASDKQIKTTVDYENDITPHCISTENDEQNVNSHSNTSNENSDKSLSLHHVTKPDTQKLYEANFKNLLQNKTAHGKFPQQNRLIKYKLVRSSKKKPLQIVVSHNSKSNESPPLNSANTDCNQKNIKLLNSCAPNIPQMKSGEKLVLETMPCLQLINSAQKVPVLMMVKNNTNSYKHIPFKNISLLKTSAAANKPYTKCHRTYSGPKHSHNNTVNLSNPLGTLYRHSAPSTSTQSIGQHSNETTSSVENAPEISKQSINQSVDISKLFNETTSSECFKVEGNCVENARETVEMFQQVKSDLMNLLDSNPSNIADKIVIHSELLNDDVEVCSDINIEDFNELDNNLSIEKKQTVLENKTELSDFIHNNDENNINESKAMDLDIAISDKDQGSKSVLQFQELSPVINESMSADIENITPINTQTEQSFVTENQSIGAQTTEEQSSSETNKFGIDDPLNMFVLPQKMKRIPKAKYRKKKLINRKELRMWHRKKYNEKKNLKKGGFKPDVTSSGNKSDSEDSEIDVVSIPPPSKRKWKNITKMLASRLRRSENRSLVCRLAGIIPELSHCDILPLREVLGGATSYIRTLKYDAHNLEYERTCLLQEQVRLTAALQQLKDG